MITKKNKNAVCLFAIIFFCLFMFSCATDQKKSPQGPVFSNEIEPIIFKHCTPCHRPGSGAPFDLLTYEDVIRRLQTIKLAVNERLMPPWPADTNYRHFRDEKVMTKEEIDLLNTWIENGAPIGDSTRHSDPPLFENNSKFGKPDMVIRMKDPVYVKGNNQDNFLMMKIPYELPADTFIQAIEIIPGNTKIVHHINAHLIQYKSGAKKNKDGGLPYVDTEKFDKLEAYEKLDLKNDDGTYPLLTPSVTNYLPGVETAFYPEGIGGYRAYKQGALLLDNIHYGPSPNDTSDQTSFNIFFSAEAPKRPVSEFILGTSGISPVVPKLVIPPNTIKKFTTSYQIPEDISLLTINPHMHLLGVSFLAYATLPNGDTIPLIRIPQWDFRWQYFYTFRKIVKIPAGSIMKAEAVFDNTEDNPLIPFHPPKTVSERDGSMRTTDEMFQLICTYIPYQPGDENISLEMNSTHGN